MDFRDPYEKKLEIEKLLEAILSIAPDLTLEEIIEWHGEEVEALLNPSNFDIYDEIIGSLDYYCHLIEAN